MHCLSLLNLQIGDSHFFKNHHAGRRVLEGGDISASSAKHPGFHRNDEIPTAVRGSSLCLSKR